MLYGLFWDWIWNRAKGNNFIPIMDARISITKARSYRYPCLCFCYWCWWCWINIAIYNDCFFYWINGLTRGCFRVFIWNIWFFLPILHTTPLWLPLLHTIYAQVHKPWIRRLKCTKTQNKLEQALHLLNKQLDLDQAKQRKINAFWISGVSWFFN